MVVGLVADLAWQLVDCLVGGWAVQLVEKKAVWWVALTAGQLVVRMAELRGVR
jgi:hypothetical protein